MNGGERKESRGINGIREILQNEIEKRKKAPSLMLLDGGVFLCAFVFARASLFFGAHPFSAAFLAVLPVYVWTALFGAVVGSLTLGTPGVIYAMISMIIVFLRVIISGGEGRMGRGILFGEKLLFRMSSATIGGFIAAVYEILLSGFGAVSILFGITMILVPPVLVLAYFGLFEADISFYDIIGRGRRVFRSGGDKYDEIYFCVSVLSLIFTVSLSLSEYSLLGISPSYLFAAAITLFTAKRFGSICGAAVGFAATLGVSGIYSVAFLILGLISGVLFRIGTIYALVGGAAAVGALSLYVGGVMGIVSTLPEYVISAALLYPVMTRLGTEHRQKENLSPEKSATDMVGTMALAYKNASRFSTDAVVSGLNHIAAALDKFISVGDGTARNGDELRLVCSLINEAHTKEESELSMNDSLTDVLENALSSTQFAEGVVRVFGDRARHVILAGRDDDGTLITSPDIKNKLEAAVSVKLGAPDYFRRGSMALMECGAVKKYSVQFASAAEPMEIGTVSGDCAKCFEIRSGVFYSVISDGMGSGEVASSAAEFTVSYLEAALSIGATRETVMHLLNRYLARGREECSVTVDLFEFDLITGEALFIKSGAASSYIKRGSSIFRIRSQTAPLGLMTAIDSEKIRVVTEPGDYVIMMSDGICEGCDDSPWLLELLCAKNPKTPKEYADTIIAAAKNKRRHPDDMTVTVVEINQL